MLPHKLKEMCRIKISVAHQCGYCSTVRSNVAKAEGLSEEADTYLPMAEWKSDVSLGVYPLPKDWADKIAARMKEVFLTRTAKEWERIFGRGKFPGAPQRWLQEWMASMIFARSFGRHQTIWNMPAGWCWSMVSIRLKRCAVCWRHAVSAVWRAASIWADINEFHWGSGQHDT